MSVKDVYEALESRLAHATLNDLEVLLDKEINLEERDREYLKNLKKRLEDELDQLILFRHRIGQ